MNTSSTRVATCVPVVTSPLSVVRAAQFSWPTHKRLRGGAEGPLLADSVEKLDCCPLEQICGGGQTIPQVAIVDPGSI
ncbi:hypothetical protein [Variovorax sp. EBFNA2]|uniref:hypothetical protein n=1 Tax=Variovorax sp. EBFNA2 TaxID=3342097 RepID=UPI0029C07A54|nr:hypothetical protein [Variovorax boronicumulans]WPG41350.1 hypothetical protein RZE79_31015 [Variovorax boronicumulans]